MDGNSVTTPAQWQASALFFAEIPIAHDSCSDRKGNISIKQCLDPQRWLKDALLMRPFTRSKHPFGAVDGFPEIMSLIPPLLPPCAQPTASDPAFDPRKPKKRPLSSPAQRRQDGGKAIQ